MESTLDLGSSFARAASALENAVLDLLAGGWEDGPRRLARGMATALRQVARDAGCWDCEGPLRALESLLALSPPEVAQETVVLPPNDSGLVERTLRDDPIIGRVLFTDGIVRPVFLDNGGNQYAIDRDGHTRCYGAWLRPEDAEADAPLAVGEPRDRR